MARLRSKVLHEVLLALGFAAEKAQGLADLGCASRDIRCNDQGLVTMLDFPDAWQHGRTRGGSRSLGTRGSSQGHRRVIWGFNMVQLQPVEMFVSTADSTGFAAQTEMCGSKLRGSGNACMIKV